MHRNRTLFPGLRILFLYIDIDRCRSPRQLSFGSTLRPIVPLEHEDKILIVVERLHPDIVDPVYEVSWLVGDLTTHRYKSPGPLRPHFVLGICRNLSLDHPCGQHKVDLRLVCQWIDLQGLPICLSFTERVDKVGDVPTLFDGGVVSERWHWSAIDSGRKRPEYVGDVIGILPAASEVPALVPVGRLYCK